MKSERVRGECVSVKMAAGTLKKEDYEYIEGMVGEKLDPFRNDIESMTLTLLPKSKKRALLEFVRSLGGVEQVCLTTEKVLLQRKV